MKRILIGLTAALLLANIASAESTTSDLIGLGLSPELAEAITAGVVTDNNTYLKMRNAAGTALISVLKVDGTDDTVLNADSGDLIKLAVAGSTHLSLNGSQLQYQPYGDSNRSFTLTAPSDTAFTFQFGDGGTTAAQWLTMSSSTSDGDDDGRVLIGGGGDASNTRGAYASFSGNEETTVAGAAQIVAGNVAGGKVQLRTIGAQPIEVETTNAVRWQFEADGDLASDATNGGNVVLGKALSGVIEYVGTLAATGTVQGDAAALVSYLTTVTGADAAKGIILPATPVAGAKYTIINTANAVLKIYPGTGDTISGLSANTNMSAAAYTVTYCHAVSTSAWWCAEPAVAG